MAEDLDQFAASEDWSGVVPPLADRFAEVVDHFYPGEFHNGVSIVISPDMTIAVKRTAFEPEITAAEVEAAR